MTLRQACSGSGRSPCRRCLGRLCGTPACGDDASLARDVVLQSLTSQVWWCRSQANLPDDLDDESSDDEGPPPLEPVGAHLRRAAEKAKREAEGAEVEEDGEATTEIEAKEMSESAFKEKVEYMVSVRRRVCAPEAAGRPLHPRPAAYP